MSHRSHRLAPDAVWFITGCSTGIGRALAASVARKGHRLVATARNPASLAYLPKSDQTLKLTLDVSDKQSVDNAVEAALHAFGRIDVLVNNAGYELRGDTENAKVEDMQKLMSTNFFGVVWLTQHAMRVMREENSKNGDRGGVVMQVTSMGGRMALPSGAFYHASKWAVEGFTESVSKEVRPEWNIHFCLIEPGGVDTDYVARSSQPIAPHPAYAAPDTPGRVLDAFLQKYKDDHGSRKTWATPEQVATAIYTVVASSEPIPLRQPLGPDSWAWLKQVFDQAVVDHAKTKDLALSVGDKQQVENVLSLKQ